MRNRQHTGSTLGFDRGKTSMRNHTGRSDQALRGAFRVPKVGTADCRGARITLMPVSRPRDRMLGRTFQIILSCVPFELSPPRGEISPGRRRV